MPSSQTNSALVFVKPHAANDAVRSLVQQRLADRGFRILSSGTCTSETIDKERIIDRHYATIARYATEWTADRLPVDAETKNKFKGTFGIEWDEAVAKHKVLNAAEAASRLGGLSASDLSARWKANSGRMKLAPGLYVTEFKDDGIFVINGFYLLNREKFTTPGGVVSWYVVEWDEGSMPWVDFRSKFIGPTDPTAAPEESLRGTIFKDWEALGLKEQPNVSDNGVHASAGPLEGLAERITWTKATLDSDAFGRRLLAEGCDRGLIEAWLQNVTAEIDGKSAPVFDLLEDKQSSDVVAIVKAKSKGTVASGKAKRVFNDDERKKLENVFKLLDEDKSGYIDSKELPNLVRYVGFTPSEAAVKDLLKRYDENHDGKLSLQEFFNLCATEDIQHDTDADLQIAFEEFDTDKSGYLSKAELSEALSTFGEPMSAEEIDDMFRGIDVNSDGKISIAEFVAAMRAPSL